MTDRVGVTLSQRVGYELKRVAAALRAAMDAELRRHGLTVPQYACLELLEQRPGLSNAELARDAFVTRQSMNVVLRGLQHSGLITRPEWAAHGRALPAELTEEGRRRLMAARDAVLTIEEHMINGLEREDVDDLLRDLGRMTDSLQSSHPA